MKIGLSIAFLMLAFVSMFAALAHSTLNNHEQRIRQLEQRCGDTSRPLRSSDI